MTGAGAPPVVAVTRGLTILGIVWQGLWLLAQPELWPTHQAHAAVGVVVAVPYVTWLGVMVTTWGPRRDARRRSVIERVNAMCLVMAGLVMLAFEQNVHPDGWVGSASMVNLGVALTGLVFSVRWAVPLVFVVIAVESLMLALGPLQAQVWPASKLLLPLYAAAVAAATIGARRGLMGAARRTQDAQQDLEQAELRSRSTRQVEKQVHEEARLLHETVLNTLTAITRGVGDSPAAMTHLRDRCRRSVEVLVSLRDLGLAGVESVPTAHGSSIDELRSLGTEVVVEAVDPDLLPEPVLRAFTSVVREALHNAARHSQARHVRVVLEAYGKGWRAEVTDDGVGFDPALGTGRFGIAEAILAPVAQIGGRASVHSVPGDGTVVEAIWEPDRGADRRGRLTSNSLVPMVGPVLVSWGVFSVGSLLASLDEYATPWLAVASLLLAVLAGALLFRDARRGMLSTAVIIGVALASPVIYRLQSLATVPGTSNTWSEWSSEAVVILLFIVAGAGPWWSWMVALAAWLVTQGNPIAELLQPGTLFIVAGALFARSVRGNTLAFEQARRRRVEELATQAAQEQSLARLTRRYAGLAVSQAPAILGGIADLSIDPHDPAVQEQCGREERYIRSVMRLDPDADELQAMAMRLAEATYRAGVILTIDIAVALTDRCPELVELESSAMHGLVALDPHGPARLSARQEGDCAVIRLVAQLRANRETAGLADCAFLHVDPADGTVMWEVRCG